MSDPKVASITGAITLEDGTTSEFVIGTDYGWQQWGATQERLGESVAVLDAMVMGFQRDEVRFVSDYDPDPEDVNDPDEGDEDPCPESEDGKHQVTGGSCDLCGAKNFN